MVNSEIIYGSRIGSAIQYGKTSDGDLAAMRVNSSGKLDIVAGAKIYRKNVTFTAVGAYSQYDQVGALTEVTNWAAFNGGGATVREIRISINKNDITPQFEVHFYNSSTVTMAGDNGTWTELAADYTKRAGYVIMPACAKPSGSGTIDLVRAQSDNYGYPLGKEVCCASDSTSVWMALKLISAATTFASSPGSTIAVAMAIEQS
mgnify:CR=1 FL=1